MNYKKLIICLIFVGLLAAFFLWQNNDIVKSDYAYTSNKLGGDLDGYKIVQVSDLHNKRFGKGQKRLLAQIEAEHPDIIVVTGDLVDSNHTNIDKAMEFIDGAVKLAPVYFVTGNHEKWLDEKSEERLMKSLEQAGVICLDNEKMEIADGDAGFTLIGLDDGSLFDDTLSNIMKDEEDCFTLLLAHEPQLLPQYSQTNADLVLSGHAHGGQVRLPGIGGLVAPDQGFFPKYTAGSYEEKETTMYISRGLGNSIIPVRIFNRPELVVITLRKGSK